MPADDGSLYLVRRRLAAEEGQKLLGAMRPAAAAYVLSLAHGDEGGGGAAALSCDGELAES